MITAYLGLGSSLGERETHLHNALARLNTPDGDIHVTAVSPLYESPHLGLTPGDETKYPPHLNCIAQIETSLSPETLLSHIRAIETEGGRERCQKWGPRTIDIDILLYGDLTYHSDILTIPHPGLALRAFVVLPLYDLAPTLRLPDSRALAEIRASSDIQAQQIELWK
jgi:2-amino-4-hydroxy-6-hydroxymethyldihydropteridine diphosphokinase